MTKLKTPDTRDKLLNKIIALAACVSRGHPSKSEIEIAAIWLDKANKELSEKEFGEEKKA